MSPIGATHLSPMEAQARYQLERAQERGLFVSPPFMHAKEQAAFLSGYETALRDLAEGKLA